MEELQTNHRHQRVIVLASGDPLFYGIGSYLVKQIGSENIEVFPYVSSIQLAFARCGESWQDAQLISLHGRSILGLVQKIDGSRKVGLLTDEVNTPSAIAKYLLGFNMTEYNAFVGREEKTGWYTLEQLAESTFSPLNVMVLKRNRSKSNGRQQFGLGISDAEFFQRKPDRGLITKREIRVLSLSELNLRTDAVLWDIGVCTGSVSIEAIRSTQGLRVFAIEKNEEDLEFLRQNQIKFRCDFTAVHGRAPARLDEFEDPDAVFIGGSGGELEELLSVCANRLRPSGHIVVNAATIETLYTAQQTLQNLGFYVSITLIQTSRSKPILNLTRFEGMNPVYMVTAWRADEGQGDTCES